MISHTVKYIVENMHDFKVCESCNDINLNKNDHCVGCMDNDFRDFDDEDKYDLEDSYSQDCELETSH